MTRPSFLAYISHTILPVQDLRVFFPPPSPISIEMCILLFSILNNLVVFCLARINSGFLKSCLTIKRERERETKISKTIETEATRETGSRGLYSNHLSLHSFLLSLSLISFWLSHDCSEEWRRLDGRIYCRP